MSEPLYSVRMRASRNGRHVSGAERIVSLPDLEHVCSELMSRAMSHERGRPDSVTVSVDSLAGKEIITLPPLPVSSSVFRSVSDARSAAVSELVRAGVSEVAALSALDNISGGAYPDGCNMRGAMVMDALSGERVEPDRHSGLRTRCVDYHAEFLAELAGALAAHGLDRTHLKEALALATKVAGAPGAIAELCISDDPSYTTGYVASPTNGYVRITPMKEHGDPMGGRAFFVDVSNLDINAYIGYMRETPVLIRGALKFTV